VTDGHKVNDFPVDLQLFPEEIMIDSPSVVSCHSHGRGRIWVGSFVDFWEMD
jgi:hypothetical protein